MKTRAVAAMPLSQELTCQNYLMRVDCISLFLDMAIKAITSTRGELGEKEQFGFHLCTMLLAQNVEGALEAGTGARHV